ncbi:MAG: glycosyltransferase family 2 protein [Gammaproteobacteria bacterium]|nr:glycosyltransferase family 2 protein [Gammaproteobacteria bacterium]
MTDGYGIAVSIIIPTFNEASTLSHSLQDLFSKIESADVEVIISDGGSSDKTQDIAQRFPCRVICGKSGRARQMNHAVKHAKGKWILFLHADSYLPTTWRADIDKARQWGFFPARLSGDHWLLRLIEYFMCLRSAITSVATGDQGLFFKQPFFSKLDGFADIPIMEDIAISKKARQQMRPDIASSAIVTSSRRWEQQGICRTMLQMWRLRLAFWVGVKPERLHRIYYPDHSQ